MVSESKCGRRLEVMRRKKKGDEEPHRWDHGEEAPNRLHCKKDRRVRGTSADLYMCRTPATNEGRREREKKKKKNGSNRRRTQKEEEADEDQHCVHCKTDRRVRGSALVSTGAVRPQQLRNARAKKITSNMKWRTMGRDGGPGIIPRSL